MIINFKIFEKISKKSFYLIKGDRIQVINTIEKFIGWNSNMNYISSRVIAIYFNIDENKKSDWDYWEIEQEIDFVNGKIYYRHQGSEYKGEMKLIDDEIVIDTLDADMEKYNL
jgi:hypothetical protein